MALITDNYVTDGWAVGIATGGSHSITLDGNVIVGEGRYYSFREAGGL